jgi:hypothetical protein
MKSKDSSSLPGIIRVLLLGLAILACLAPQPVGAQAVSGTILGTVKDTQGAAIAKAKMTLTHTATRTVRTVTTDAKGEYVAPSLPTGTYTISGEVEGFKTVSLSNVHLGVDQKLRMDLTLEVGGIAEVVEIAATTPLLQTSSSDLGATIGESQIQTLPLNGRNFVQLTRTIPGVSRGNVGANIDGSAGSYGWRMSASFTANGQRPRDNNFMLDGVDNNEAWLNTVVIFPSVDALEEFKLQTSTYSAEFGRSMGGVVNIQVKSGSNEFHGSAFEFMRNDKWDANDWFNNRAQRTRPDFSQHQFGATIGGPIITDRTFFFADYQGWRITQGLTMLSNVPTDRMRNGDFSELNRVIYDPLTGLPFPGNVIPADRIDPAARNIVDRLYPTANAAGTVAANGQVINNYILNPNLEREDNQFDVKLDHQLTARNRLSIRYSFEKAHRLLPSSLPVGDGGANAAGYGSAGIGDIKGQSLSINDTHSFSSAWLNEFRFGWTSIDIRATPYEYGTNMADQVGIPGINLGPLTSAMTGIGFTPAQEIRGLGPTGSQPLFAVSTGWNLVDNVTHVRGRHTFKAGVSLLLRKREVYNSDNGTGGFGFNANLTSNCAGRPAGCTLNTNTGFSFASFMLGYANTYGRALMSDQYTERKPDYGAFIQDDFRVTPKLTLNLGLRWDVFTPYTEDNDRQSNFDTSTGTFVVASDDAVINGIQVGRRLQTYSKTDFAPRLGFAYDLFGSGKTVVRGGFGMFWNNPLTGTSSSKGQLPPWLLSQTITSSTFVPTLRISDGVPAPSPVTGGSTRSSFDPNFRDGYAQQWNLNVQQQLGANYMFEIGYVGSRGRQLVVRRDVNQAQPVVGVTNPNVNRPFYGVNPGLTQVAQSVSNGKLDYHALQVRFVRRFANGFSFFNSYTWSKALDYDSDTDGNATFTNSYDYAYNWGPASYDLTHQLTSNWIYELPFLRKSKLGGWQLSGILLLRSGYAFTVVQSQGVLSTGAGNRPNRIGSGVSDNPTIDRWFNLDDFVPTTDNTGTYGDSGRNILRGPGQFTIDASLIKITRFGRIESELRVEAFNLLNHPVFANPNATIGSANAGLITSLLSLTPMRQVQVALKLKF